MPLKVEPFTYRWYSRFLSIKKKKGKIIPPELEQDVLVLHQHAILLCMNMGDDLDLESLKPRQQRVLEWLEREN